MTLTLRSSNLFLKNLRRLKASEDIPSLIYIARIKSSYRIRAITSLQANYLTAKKISSLERRSNEKWEKLHELTTPHHTNETRVPVYVMLPLDTISTAGTLNKARAMNASIMALKTAGVEGVMVDVWWDWSRKTGSKPRLLYVSSKYYGTEEVSNLRL